jgi:hypothetical protein
MRSVATVVLFGDFLGEEEREAAVGIFECVGVDAVAEFWEMLAEIRLELSWRYSGFYEWCSSVRLNLG